MRFIARWLAPFSRVEVRPATAGHALEPARTGPNLVPRTGVSRNLLPQRLRPRALELVPFRRAQVRHSATVARVVAHPVERFGELFRFGPPRPVRVRGARTEPPLTVPVEPVLSASELLDREFDRHPQLSRERTQELLAEYATLGPLETVLDPESGHERRRRAIPRALAGRARALMHELVLGHLRLCMHWVLHGSWASRSQSLTRDDYFQEAVLGLMRAIELFEPERGVELGTYAFQWIRNAMSRGRAATDRLIRLPLLVLRAKTISAAEYHRLARPTPFSQVRKRELQARRDARAPNPAAILIEGEALQGLGPAIETVLAGLRERERLVLRRRYGLGDQPVETLQEIGDALGLTRERVRQIQFRAIRRLREGARRAALAALLPFDPD